MNLVALDEIIWFEYLCDKWKTRTGHRNPHLEGKIKSRQIRIRFWVQRVMGE